MTWNRNCFEDSVATPAQMRRFAINENFDAVRSDPRNADYLKPLANPKAEMLAGAFAEGAFDGIARGYGGFDSAEESSWCRKQCYINGRKFMCEPEYAVLFENVCDGMFLPEKAKRRSRR
jgi:hypothetical protein